MRIRKNAAISLQSFSETSIAPPCAFRPSVETHLCELNRSPWDVISFAPQSCPDEYQVEINDCVMGVESVNAVDSSTVVSLKNEVMEEKFKEEALDNEEEERRFSLLADVDHKAKQSKKKIGSKKGKESTKGYICCNKTDGKGWQCRREAKQGHSLCEHHLTQLRSYHYNYTHSGLKSDHLKPVLSVNSRRRNRTKRLSTSFSSSSSVADPSEFYYYSGFGPSWGKKRSGTVTASASTSSCSRAHDSIVHDNDEDEEDDDDEEDHGVEADAPKKRVRKPIKARSLKSLL